MITPLDPVAFDTGLKAYLDHRFATTGLTVPKITGAAAPEQAPPAVHIGLSKEVIDISDITVAIKTPAAQPKVDGWYLLEPLLVVVIPLLTEGLEIDDASPVVAAIGESFPARPRADASDEDRGAWALYQEEFSARSEAACGYRIRGWSHRAPLYNKSGNTVEQIIQIRVGVIHPDLD